VLHHDPKRTVVAVNVLYKVGSRNDPPGRTGFAHLFEHLMFGGSENVPDFDEALQLAGGSGPEYRRPALPQEPEQTETRRKEVIADVPSPVIYLSYLTPGRMHPDFPAIDILCFLLGSGRSSLLYRRLVRDGDLFAEASASHNDSLDSGSIMIDARPDEDADYDEARTALFKTIAEFVEKGVTEPQLAKVMNRLEQHNHFKSINISSRASELAFYAALGKPELINAELKQYLAVTVADVNRVARAYLRPERLSEVDYFSEEE